MLTLNSTTVLLKKDLLDWMYDNKWKAIAFVVLQP